MDKNHKDPEVIDLNVLRHAQYSHNAWKRHQDEVYWVDIKLATKKGVTFHQTRPNAIILQETLPAYCIPKVVRMESHLDCLGESEGSLPPRHDSFPDAGEATNDFWSMSGSFIYRHHVELGVKLYSPREESFPIPLKYIDVSRTTYKFGCQARETHR